MNQAKHLLITCIAVTALSGMYLVSCAQKQENTTVQSTKSTGSQTTATATTISEPTSDAARSASAVSPSDVMSRYRSIGHCMVNKLGGVLDTVQCEVCLGMQLPGIETLTDTKIIEPCLGVCGVNGKADPKELISALASCTSNP